ncbi:MAG: nucleotidyl transferase AbiEii/AbiGii toxin family protein [Rhodobacteraceae bacterium]|nr:nucleotidyl transferase AbiEii/AbiGii toxin family protein [Paracoccaceae bacterium]
MTPRPTDEQKLHQKIMYHVVMAMQDTPHVLKGGTALLLTRGLDRHSVDLDFDAGKRLNIERRIRQGVMAAGMELLSLTMPRNTATGQRYHVHYRDRVTGVSDMLRVETSFRSPPQAAQVETVNGIRTYRVEHLIGQKITALTSRTKVRDLYDLAFLARMHGNHFTQEQIQETRSLLHDPDEAVARFQDALAEDRIWPGESGLKT